MYVCVCVSACARACVRACENRETETEKQREREREKEKRREMHVYVCSVQLSMRYMESAIEQKLIIIIVMRGRTKKNETDRDGRWGEE